MESSGIIIVVEFKNCEINGPLVDQIIGSSMRARAKAKPSTLSRVVIFCRGVIGEAEERAKELEQELNVKIAFKVIPR